MAKTIISEDKELILDFSYIQNVLFANNNTGLDLFTKKLKIKNVNNFNDFIIFLKNSIVEKGFICLLSDSKRKLKNNDKEVFDGIIRIVLNKSSQDKFQKDSYIGFFIDINPNRPSLIINNIFITKLKPKPQDFETTIGNCEIFTIRFGKEISDNEIIKRGIINSTNIMQINKIHTSFNENKEKWLKYIDFCQDQIDIRRRDAVPYLNLQKIKVLKIKTKFNKLDFKEYFISDISNDRYIYLKYNALNIVQETKIPYIDIYILSIDTLVKENQDLNFIKKGLELYLCPLNINKKYNNNFYAKTDISNYYDFEFEKISENIEKIKLDDLIHEYQGSGKFIEYWKSMDKIFLGDINKLNKYIETNKETMNELRIKRFVYECYENLDNNYESSKENILNQGYVIQMSIGEEVLINRYRNVLRQISEGKTKNPYLINYLFNTKLIELAQSEIDVNEEEIKFYFKLNDYQKKAVIQALNTKDIFVIQGPPGTGKTQVISEIAYQLAKRNCKILISSQNHEAINNVIERLPRSPDINKIRLSSQANPWDNNYTPENVVYNYYKSINSQILNDNFYSPDKINEINDLKNKISLLINVNKSVYDSDKEIISLDSNIEKISNEISNLNTKYSNSEKVLFNLNKDLFYIDRLALCIDEDDYNVAFDSSKRIDKQIADDIGIYIDSFLVKKLGYSDYDFDSIFKKMKTISNLINTRIPMIKEIKKLKEEIKDTQNNVDFKNLENLKSSLKNKLFIIEKFDIYNEFVNLYKMVINKLNIYKKSIDKQKNNIEKEDIFENIKSLEIEKNKLSIIRANKISNASMQLSELSSLAKEMKQKFNIDVDISNEKVNQFLDIKLKEVDSRLDQISKRKNILNPIYNLVNNYTKNIFGSDLDKDNISIKDCSKKLINETKKYSNLILDKLINIFAMTLTSTNLYRFDKINFQKDLCINNIDLRNDDIEYVIIDEASKATIIEILMPLVYGKVLILVGDYRQLPPILKLQKEDIEYVNKKTGKYYNFEEFYNTLDQSLFKEMVSANNGSITTILNKQYRCHSQIADIVNIFYDNQLITDPKLSDKKLHGLEIFNHKGDLIISRNSSVYWIDSTYDLGKEIAYERSEIFSTSLFNENEIAITVDMVKKINDNLGDKKTKYKPSLAIISFYGLHMQKLKSELNNIRLSNINLIISTVDDFQGKEADYVIVNIVRNPEKLSSTTGREFLKRYERINVAFSRAKELLVIIGSIRAVANVYVDLPLISNPNETRKKEVYTDIIAKISQSARIMTIEDIMEK
ncbi:AAA domain-containing protein [Spiroplasma endosymbiont of Aspidapion aeneum]|uniref:AAA domain-containing protein n=1 Tax=Spiroplasma endosymbiont of Aspidapion aeneum TaxID=3066276 RepID=UPI00313D6B6E